MTKVKESFSPKLVHARLTNATFVTAFDFDIEKYLVGNRLPDYRRKRRGCNHKNCVRFWRSYCPDWECPWTTKRASWTHDIGAREILCQDSIHHETNVRADSGKEREKQGNDLHHCVCSVDVRNDWMLWLTSPKSHAAIAAAFSPSVRPYVQEDILGGKSKILVGCELSRSVCPKGSRFHSLILPTSPWMWSSW